MMSVRANARALLTAERVALNLLTVATAVAASALLREESRGAHWRDDHEGSRPDWQGHLEVRSDPATGLTHRYVPTVQEER